MAQRTMADDGRFVVAWQGEVRIAPFPARAQPRVRAKAFARDATPITAAIVVAAPDRPPFEGLRFAVGYTRNGDLVIAWPVLALSPRAGGVFTAGPQHL